MPKVVPGNNYSKKYSEEDLTNAIEAVTKRKISKKHASKMYNVPRATLQHRLKIISENKTIKSTPGPTAALTKEEEIKIVDWLNICYRIGFPRKKSDVQTVVRDYLSHIKRPNTFKNNMPGTGWFKLFFKRHPSLYKRTVSENNSDNYEIDIKNWFMNVQNYLKDKNILHLLEDPTRIYNADETTFELCPNYEKIFGPRKERNNESNWSHTKYSMTVMFTFSAAGNSSPPTLIYPRKKPHKKITKQVPKGWIIGHSRNGCMNSDVFFEYIQNVLQPHLLKIKTKFPVIVFINGNKIQMTYKLNQLCNKLQIVLIALYPHITKFFNPEMTALKPFKNNWRKGVLTWRKKNPNINLTIEHFATILKIINDNYIKQPFLENGFRTCGLYPWNIKAINFSSLTEKHTSKQVSTSVLSYKEFENIVGCENIKKFQMGILNDQTGIYKILYDIWKVFEEKNKYQKNNSYIDEDYILKDMISEFDLPFQDVLSEVIINENDSLDEDIDFNIENMPIIFENELNTINTTQDLINPDQTDEICFNHNNVVNNLEKINSNQDDLSKFLKWPNDTSNKRNNSFILSENCQENSIIHETKVKKKLKKQKK